LYSIIQFFFFFFFAENLVGEKRRERKQGTPEISDPLGQGGEWVL
jgi:hypothetical protein